VSPPVSVSISVSVAHKNRKAPRSFRFDFARSVPTEAEPGKSRKRDATSDGLKIARAARIARGGGVILTAARPPDRSGRDFAAALRAEMWGAALLEAKDRGDRTRLAADGLPESDRSGPWGRDAEFSRRFERLVRGGAKRLLLDVRSFPAGSFGRDVRVAVLVASRGPGWDPTCVGARDAAERALWPGAARLVRGTRENALAEEAEAAGMRAAVLEFSDGLASRETSEVAGRLADWAVAASE